jgi:large subunit ribosomal protein L7A
MKMSYEKVKQASKTIIGTKQAVKAIKQNQVKELIVALDADNRVTDPVIILAQEIGLPVHLVKSKKELGKACGIHVAAAVVAIASE